jgi:hypothetical protein
MHTGEFLPWSWLTLFLQNSDKLQAACWGRPASIRPTDFDVRLPNLDDFEERDVQAQVFVHSTNMYIIVGKIAELCSSTQPTSPEGLSELTALLREWLHFLPEDLQLYDSADNRRQYYRPVCDMYIVYFTAIILIQSMHKHHEKHRRTSPISAVASSCIVALYEEIYYRQQAHFLLHIH